MADFPAKESQMSDQNDPVLALGTVLEHPCPECGWSMVLRTSKFGLFYGCTQFPACTAAHGAHKDGRPLGIPANKATKDARIKAHAAFDRLWKDKHMKRKEAYVWMQGAMSMTADDAHIGRFTIEQCEQLEAAVAKFFEAKT